jgi:uncharacterized membrane protein
MLASERGRRLVLGINLALLGLLWIYTLVRLPLLPARIPMHYNAAGVVDSWQTSGAGTWLMPALIALGLNLFIWVIAVLVRKLPPAMINLPKESQRREFTRLPREERRPVYLMFDSLLFYLMLPMNIMFLLVQYSTFMVGTGRWQTLPRYSWLCMAAIFILLAFLIPQLIKELDDYLARIRG